MKQILPALRSYLVLTVLLGVIYPLAMTAAAKLLFPHQAEGSLVTGRNGAVVGSEWIAQKFESPKYFWPRPSAVDYNPLPSGGSNLGPTSEALKKVVTERTARLRAADADAGPIPQDLLFASGSGLDPDISPEAAEYQVARVAAARGVDPARIREEIVRQTQRRTFGVLGQPTVNVLRLNLALGADAETK